MTKKSRSRKARDLAVKHARTPEQEEAHISQQRTRLKGVIMERINMAGSILGEALDHIKAGDIGLAEIGALAEVSSNVNEAVSLVAFYMRADEKVVKPEILVPESEIIAPPAGLIVPG